MNTNCLIYNLPMNLYDVTDTVCILYEFCKPFDYIAAFSIGIPIYLQYGSKLGSSYGSMWNACDDRD